MYKVAITGGIASGKTTVTNILRQLGAQVIDADEIARALTLPGGMAAPAILARFGTLDRRALADRIFHSANDRLALNAIVHPLVAQEMAALIAASAEAIIVLDIPLLYESGMASIADEVWVVHIPEPMQLQRLMARNGLTAEEAFARIRSQMPIDEKLKMADAGIDNTGTIEQTRLQTAGLWLQACGKAGL